MYSAVCFWVMIVSVALVLASLLAMWLFHTKTDKVFAGLYVIIGVFMVDFFLLVVNIIRSAVK